MKSPATKMFLLGLLSLPVRADVVVNFNNDVLGTQAKVHFMYDQFCHVPVVNDVGGRNFKVQLFWQDGGSLSPVGGPATFRPISPADPLAGTWNGGVRILEGVPADTQVMLLVRAWNADFVSFDAAINGGTLVGQSLPFVYQHQSSDPPQLTDAYMVNFPGFYITWTDGGMNCIPEPETWTLVVAGGVAAWIWRCGKVER